MTGLILKDVLVLNKTMKTYILFLIFYFVFSSISRPPPRA